MKQIHWMNQIRQSKSTLFNSQGNAAGAVIAGVGVLAVIAAFVGLSVRDNALTRNTEAATIRNSQVRLMTIDTADSGCTQRVTKNGDRSVTVCGRVCFSQNYRSGGQDTGSLYLTDVGGSRLHEGNTTFTFGVAALDFPAPCDYTNADIGEAELKNGQATKSNLFNIPLTFDQPLTDSYCPDVYVNYRARVTSGMPFAKVSLRDAGVCTPAPTAVPPTAAPRQDAPQVTQPPAEPQSGKITGTISVYSCQKPQSIGLESCKDKDCKESEMTSLRYNAESESSPLDTGIWLEDTNNDNTWVYRYSFDTHRGEPLTSGQEYTFKRAFATINSSAQPNSSLYYSQKDESEKLSLKPGTVQDYSISAEKTCGCPFNATAYVRSGTTGEIITDFDKEIAIYGSANNKQIIDRGDKPVQAAPFIGGKVVVNAPNFVPNVAGGFGEDALASIKLYAPNYTITKQKCVSTGDVDSCPTYAKSYEKEASQLANPNIFENVRVACGTNVEYGWYVLSPTPTPVPIVNGSVEVRVFTWVNSETETPSTCSYDQLTSSVGRGSIYKFLGECELELFDEAGKSVVVKELEAYDAGKGFPGCNYQLFENLPAGKYSLRVGGLTSLFNGLCKEARNFEVKAGQTTKVPAMFAVDLDKCDPRALTESTCDACRGKDGRCLTRYKEGSNERLCCVGQGSDEGRSSGSGGGDNGGGGGGAPKVCQQWCATPEFCKSQGWESRTPPTGQTCSNSTGPDEAWCCEPGSTMPAGTSDPAPDPGQFFCGQDTEQGGTQCVNENQCDLGNVVAVDGGCSESQICCLRTTRSDDPPGVPPGTPRTDSCNREGGICRSSCSSQENEISGPGLCSGSTPSCCKSKITELPRTQPVSNIEVNMFLNYKYGELKIYPEVCNRANGDCYLDVAPLMSDNSDNINFYTANRAYKINVQGTKYVGCRADYFSTDTPWTQPVYVTSCQCNRKAFSNYDKAHLTVTVGQNGQLSGDVNNCRRVSGFNAEKYVDPSRIDIDKNGIINSIDITLINEKLGSSADDVNKLSDSGSTIDINEDGKINALDVSLATSLFGTEL